MNVVTLDFETFWSQDHSLSKMLPSVYVMHPDTQIISCSVKVNDGTSECFFGEGDVLHRLSEIDWATSMALGHNMSGFDCMLLAWRLGIRPRMWGCTMAMARPLHRYDSLGLAALVKRYGIGAKDNTALLATKGKRLEDFTLAERRDMAVYNNADADQCYDLFKILRPATPAREMWLIDSTIRMLAEPQFELDRVLCVEALKRERAAKIKSLDKLAAKLGVDTVDEMRDTVMSAVKFSALLDNLGVDVPMKESPKKPGTLIPALAKTDEAFLALMEHDDPLVAAAARTRLGAKSTLLETRLEAFISVGDATNGVLPVPVKYAGAHTYRDSGEQYNCQNLPRIGRDKHGAIVPKRTNALRMSMRAPRGKRVIVADQSGIELRVNHFLWKVEDSMALYTASPGKADLYRAFAASLYNKEPDDVTKPERQMGKVCVLEGTLVLTDQGEVPIEHVTPSHKVWDGIEWVSTMGAIFKGVKDVITYDGLSATPDHEVWVEDGRKVPFGAAAAQSLRLARTGADRRTLEPAIVQTQGRVWDLLNCGPRSRFTANGRLVSNCQLGLGFSAGWRTFMRVAKTMGGVDISEEEAQSTVYAWRDHYYRIVEGWGKCQNALEYIMAGESIAIDPWGLLHTEPGGIRLPSGRLIRYPNLRNVRNEDTGRNEMVYADGRHTTYIYGGRVTENVVQALACDSIMDCSIEYFKRTGLRPALRVHDELVYVVDEAAAEGLLDELQDVMRTPPKWWPDLIVWSDGSAALTYGDAK